jgi:hypothetical protein
MFLTGTPLLGLISRKHPTYWGWQSKSVCILSPNHSIRAAQNLLWEVGSGTQFGASWGLVLILSLIWLQLFPLASINSHSGNCSSHPSVHQWWLLSFNTAPKSLLSSSTVSFSWPDSDLWLKLSTHYLLNHGEYKWNKSLVLEAFLINRGNKEVKNTQVRE